MSEDIREIIMRELKARGWTKHKLSTESGVLWQTLHPFLAGKRNIGVDNLQKITDTLDLELTPRA